MRTVFQLVSYMVLFGFISVASTPSGAVCLDVPADVNFTGQTDVGDVRCSILGGLWELSGPVGPHPRCYYTYSGLTIYDLGDLNCDGEINVSDILLAIAAALKQPWDEVIDADGDWCHDDCE